MIKLNNKNITYVALADSNNSLKAPKEIWYADSSNSVKLVYRRKDALIEGVDYEKYHWSQGRNGAYIDTLHKIKAFDDKFEVHYHYDGNIKNPDNGVQDVFGYASENNNAWIRHYITSSNYAASNYFKQAGDWYHSGIITNDATIELWADASSFYYKVNDNNFTFSTNGLEAGEYPNCYVFACNGLKQTYSNRYFHGDIAYFKITDPTFTTDKLHLIPCKLLKPVPKWLDANGIRRQVGECGMIDLISGKFYGNVNSVGTFTVENYYERKEWLKGDGNAYIDTDIIVDVPSLYISTSFTKKVGNSTPLFGSRDYVTSNGSQIWYLSDGNLRLDIITNGADYVNVDSNDIQSYNQLIVDCSNNVVSVNETTFSSDVDNLSVKNSSNTFKIFSLEVLNNPNTYNKPYNGAFGNFIFKDDTHSLNLIPCTLTMDLPASMDANNIARTKGTSGMWDLVSDRFYGNVASSGTFKAVNLAEGVDYEVHQWLKGDGSAYINTKVKLHFATDSIYIKGSKNNAATNKARFFGNYSGGENAKSLELIYYTSVQSDTVSKPFVTDGRFGINPSSEFEFHTTPFSSTTSVSIIYDNTDTIFNVNLDDSYLNYEASNDLILLNTNDTRYCMKADVANFKVMRSSTIIRNLIPVKLLRSIPSKYDANGIARQAGECGMYDTVNDVFYGNVASSGSFTVSDDN